MNSEFEEKQFEAPLNAELAHSGGLFFPTGQVLESLVGFDAALLTHDIRFWRYFGQTNPPAGAFIRAHWWGLKPSDINALPKFKFNLFLQHKRPEYCKGPRGKHRAHFGAPYYRFKVTPHQQAALEKMAGGTAGASIVSYACPALHTLRALFDHIRNRTLVDSTNFVEVTKLKGHKTYNFLRGGASGLANDEIEEIEGEPLGSTIGRLRNSQTKHDSNAQFIKETGIAAKAAITKTRFLRRIFPQLSFIEEISRDPLVEAFYYISLFNFATGVSWSIGHE